MPLPWTCRAGATVIGLSITAAALVSLPAAAQDAIYFSPTYAASQGSPYSDVYLRAFGAGGQPAEQLPAGPPLATAAPPVPPAPESNVVYVIENGRLLTFSAEAYAAGSKEALATAPLPMGQDDAGAAGAELPDIADRLYGPAPLETAAGAGSAASDAPIRLLPPPI